MGKGKGEKMKKIKKKKRIIEAALKLFSTYGFHGTTMMDITKSLGMSAGNIYTYFPSKKSLAKSAIMYVSKLLTIELQMINSQLISPQEKIISFVKIYLTFLEENPEHIHYFMRVYLANREIFCEEETCAFALAEGFIGEIRILVDNGIASDAFVEQDFCISLATIVGILGGITFLKSEGVLASDLDSYASDLAKSINKALSI